MREFRSVCRVGKLEERQHAGLRIVAQGHDAVEVLSKQGLDIARGAISSAYPNDLWGKTAQEAEFAEVSVFRYDDAVVLTSVLPHGLVTRGVELNCGHMQRLCKNIGQTKR